MRSSAEKRMRIANLRVLVQKVWCCFVAEFRTSLLSLCEQVSSTLIDLFHCIVLGRIWSVVVSCRFVVNRVPYLLAVV